MDPFASTVAKHTRLTHLCNMKVYHTTLKATVGILAVSAALFLLNRSVAEGNPVAPGWPSTCGLHLGIPASQYLLIRTPVISG